MIWRIPDKQFDDILDRMDQTLDPKERGVLVRQALGILEQDIPPVEITWVSLVNIWYPYVKDAPDQASGGVEFRRWDPVWFD